MSKPCDRDKEFSKILLAEMDANMFKDHSSKSQVSTLSIPFYYKLCVESERDYQPAQTELTLHHAGGGNPTDNCRTLDFLQDRQTNRGCLLRYDKTALQLRGREVWISDQTAYLQPD